MRDSGGTGTWETERRRDKLGLLSSPAVKLIKGKVLGIDLDNQTASGPSASHVPEATLRDPPRAVTSVLDLKSTEAHHLLAADIRSFTELATL